MRAAKDSSIRESIALSEVTNRPTSVSGFESGKRADKSPAAIFSAVSSTATSGRKPTLITMREANPINKSAIRPMKIKTTRKRAAVSSTPDNDCATKTEPIADGNTRAKTRKSEPGISKVNGRSPYLAALAGKVPKT